MCPWNLGSVSLEPRYDCPWNLGSVSLEPRYWPSRDNVKLSRKPASWCDSPSTRREASATVPGTSVSGRVPRSFGTGCGARRRGRRDQDRPHASLARVAPSDHGGWKPSRHQASHARPSRHDRVVNLFIQLFKTYNFSILFEPQMNLVANTYLPDLAAFSTDSRT